MKFDVYGVTDTGCVRQLNEDNFCICGFENNNEPGYCVVADGMGGHNAGEVASQLAIDFITESLNDILQNSENPDVPRRINDALNSANESIYKMAREDKNRNGMGTTTVICTFANGEGYIANVGDSRAYACRNDEIYQITIDHSIVEEMVANGSITREEARVHPQKNIITRAIGSEKTTKADIFEYEYKLRDSIIICSDGLSGMVEDATILKTVQDGKSSKEIADNLCELAKKNGGVDNITVIAIRIMEEESSI